jgi:hypothetical protein
VQDRDPLERASEKHQRRKVLRIIISLFPFALPCREIIHVTDRNKLGSHV